MIHTLLVWGFLRWKTLRRIMFTCCFMDGKEVNLISHAKYAKFLVKKCHSVGGLPKVAKVERLGPVSGRMIKRETNLPSSRPFRKDHSYRSIIQIYRIYFLVLPSRFVPECVAKGSCVLSWGSGRGGMFARRFVLFSLIASSRCLWRKWEKVM